MGYRVSGASNLLPLRTDFFFTAAARVNIAVDSSNEAFGDLLDEQGRLAKLYAGTRFPPPWTIEDTALASL